MLCHVLHPIAHPAAFRFHFTTPYLQRNSADNAFRLYCKTRPPAAAESVKRARTLPKASLLATLVHGTCGGSWWDSRCPALPCLCCATFRVNATCGFESRDLACCVLAAGGHPPHPVLTAALPSDAPAATRRARVPPNLSLHTPDWSQEGIHPLLAAALPSDALGGLEAQAGLADIAAALKSYRPSQTVFEAEVAAARKGSGAGGPRLRSALVGGVAPAAVRRNGGGAQGRGCGWAWLASAAGWRCPAAETMPLVG